MKPKSFMLIAGEASGDLLAAELVHALRQEFAEGDPIITPDYQPLYTSLEPRFFGAGGPRMAAAGVELAFDMTTHSVIGLSDALKNYFKFRRLFQELYDLALDREPDAIICVDFSGFNHRFAHTIKEYVRAIEGLASEKEVKVISDVPDECVITTQPDRLRSVLLNLLSNAVEYNRVGGTVRIALTRENGEIDLVVQDTGVGIPAEHLPHVFEPFYRANRSARDEHSHLGLGLFLVRSHIEAMGGSVAIESRPGEGTTLRVRGWFCTRNFVYDFVNGPIGKQAIEAGFKRLVCSSALQTWTSSPIPPDDNAALGRGTLGVTGATPYSLTERLVITAGAGGGITTGDYQVGPESINTVFNVEIGFAGMEGKYGPYANVLEFTVLKLPLGSV